ncbi:MAG: P1 family peptidase, partial [Candidatus Aminicenantaceae bacterium]
MNRRNFIKSTLSGIPLLSSKLAFQRNQADSIHPAHSSLDRRLRAREMGIVIGELEPGPLNAITDVEGVKVGHTTISKGEGKNAVRTGVTVILPNSGRIMEEQLYSAYFSLNGWGEMTGVAPIEETGKLTTPIFLTGTYN